MIRKAVAADLPQAAEIYDAILDREETARLLREIIDSLPEDQRAVIGMFYYQEMPVKDIAAALGASESAVKSRLLYGRRKIEAKVRELEKSGTKLYGLAPIPFLLWLLRGREVYAVPGPIDAPTSVGCNQLIRDGGGLVTEAWDLLREYEARFPDKLRPEAAKHQPSILGYQARQKEEPKPVPPTVSLSHNDLSLTDDQIALLKALPEEEPMLVDDLIEQTDLPTRRVLSALTVLEIEHLVQQHSGKRYTRAVTLTE